MGNRKRLAHLIEIRDLLEDAYADITNAIKKEQLANAIIKLANNEGVMQLLNRQDLPDKID